MGDLQDVRRFTVQIQHAITKKICGTGFVVCSTGKVVTCKHVVAQANELGVTDDGTEVSVYFEPAEHLQYTRTNKLIVYCVDMTSTCSNQRKIF